MGIPVFFKTCIQDYNNICFPLDDRIIDSLFFDLNCLIHPCCRGETDENIMCKKILDNINLLVNKVNPTKLIYIAIDGPCPKPKMQQQRYRRYKSALEGKQWDTNAISPGTKFMNKLEKYLNKNLNFDTDYIFDSSQNVGEGEHKIYHHIRESKLNNNVVYGLDADLIMLSLISNYNIYLLRERTEYNIECIKSDYIYLDILKLKNQIIESIKPKNYLLNDKNLINDYIFICFILGNDFIYHTPSINIRYNGLEPLLNTYNKLQTKYNGIFQIVDYKELHPIIIFKNFKEFIYELSLNEDNRIKNILYRRDKQQQNFKLRDGEDIKNHYPLLHREKEKEIFKNNTWRCNYYSYYLYDKSYDKKDNDDILNNLENINKKYFESFVWTLNYYMGYCIPWQWSYDYIYAPDLKSFYRYLDINNDKLESFKFDDNFKLKQNKPTKIKDQLNYILPDNSHNITRYKLDKKNIDIENLKYCCLLKRYSWESIPKI